MAFVRRLPDGSYVDEFGNPVAAPTGPVVQAPGMPPWLETAGNAIADAGKLALAVPRAAMGAGQAIAGALSSPTEDPAQAAAAPGTLPPAVPTLTPGLQSQTLPAGAAKLERTSETSTRSVPTKAEPGLERDLALARGRLTSADEAAADTTREQGIARREGEVAGQIADANAEQARREREEIGRAQAEQDQIRAAQDLAITKARETSTAEYERYSKMKPKDYWDVPTGTKVGRLLGIALGGIGAAIAGNQRNQALEILDKMMDRHDAQERFKIEQQRQKWLDSRIPVDEAERRKNALLVDAEHKSAGLRASIAAEAKERLTGLGRGAEQIKTDATVLKFEREAEAKKAQAEARALEWVQGDLQREISKRAQVTSTRTLSDPGAGGGKGAQLTPTEAREIVDIDQDIKELDRLARVIGTAPKGWTEYRDNQESWARKEAAPGGLKAIRGAAQAFGVADISPEQGLRSESARGIHRGMEALKTSIAKKGGGVITQGDRSAAAASLATLATGSKEQVKLILQLRDDLQARKNAFLQSRGHAVPQQQATPAQAPQGAPAQGVPVKVRSKKTGQMIDAIQLPDGRIVAAGG